MTDRQAKGRSLLVPALVGLLVFSCFAALGIHQANERHLFGSNWLAVEALVEKAPEIPGSSLAPTTGHADPAGKRVALRIEHAGKAHSAVLDVPVRSTEVPLAAGTAVRVLMDPENPGRIAWLPGPADWRALAWTVGFGLLVAAVTFAIGVLSGAGNPEPTSRNPSGPAGVGQQPKPSLPAQVADTFGLALLGIGSFFALSALWAAIADGSWVGAQGAVIIFAAAVALWRICRWLAEKVLS
jgi:hypothetical protein